MNRILPIFILIAMVTPLVAIPIPATKPVDIKGTVLSYVWVDKTFFKYVGDDFNLGSAGRSAHYYIILKTSSLTAKERDDLSSTAKIDGFTGLSHPISVVELKAGEMIVQISRPEIKRLKKGSVIELTGYSLSGDEWGTDETFKTLVVDGVEVKKPAEQGGARQPATAVDSKSTNLQGSSKNGSEGYGALEGAVGRLGWIDKVILV